MKKIILVFAVMLVLLCACSKKIPTAPLSTVDWKLVGTAGFSPTDTYVSPALLIDNGQIYAAFSSFPSPRPTPDNVTVMEFNGTSWAALGPSGFAVGRFPKLLKCSGEIYVAFSDMSQATAGVTVMKYSGSAWSAAGAARFATGDIGAVSFCADNNILYVAFADNTTNIARVMTFNGSSWTQVGPDITGARNPSLAFESGVPYVNFMDMAQGNHGSLVKLVTGAWQNIGAAGFTPDVAYMTDLTFVGTVPYVAFPDMISGDQKMTVMKYEGGSWQYVGARGISSDISYNGTDAGIFNDNGTLYCYGESQRYTTTTIRRVMVMKLVNNNWVDVGRTDFAEHSGVESVGFYTYNSVPYVIFGDGALGLKATVMKYE